MRDDFLVQYNRPGNELGEKGDKSSVIGKGIMPGLPRAAVDNKRELLEGKKADAQGEKNVFQVKVRPEDIIDIFNEEIVVFKIKYNGQVYTNPGKQTDAVRQPGLGKGHQIAD